MYHVPQTVNHLRKPLWSKQYTTSPMRLILEPLIPYPSCSLSSLVSLSPLSPLSPLSSLLSPLSLSRSLPPSLSLSRRYDSQMMSSEDQFQSRMLEGVKQARAVFILLSREALASGNCLREIRMAREQQLNPMANTRIVILAMEDEVTYAAIDAWPIKSFTFFSDKDKVERTVHARTVKFVKEHLLGVNIYQEWIKAGAKDQAKDSVEHLAKDKAKQSQVQGRGEGAQFGV
ncbi:hypothetical protein T484DRAFT_2535681 [Baffinella frigidus]|nr:hypothetical protein T484DRAFT_2535681 [Cryptophyta sp. CCMP2293]